MSALLTVLLMLLVLGLVVPDDDDEREGLPEGPADDKDDDDGDPRFSKETPEDAYDYGGLEDEDEDGEEEEEEEEEGGSDSDGGEGGEGKDKGGSEEKEDGKQGDGPADADKAGKDAKGDDLPLKDKKPADDADRGSDDDSGAKKDGEKKTETKPDDFKLEIDESLYGPEIVEQLKSIVGHFNSKVSSMQSKLDGLETAKAADQEMRLLKWADSKFEGLGEGFVELVGEGPGHKLDKEGDYYTNRTQVIEKMTEITYGRERMGKEELPPDSLFEEAINSVFAKQSTKVAERKVSKKLRTRERQMTHKPTQRKSGKDKLQPGRSKAIAGVKAFLRGKGLGGMPDPDDDEF